MVIAPTVIWSAIVWSAALPETFGEGPGAEEVVTGTATASAPRAGGPERTPDALGEPPLTDEELALLAALDARTATTSTRAGSNDRPRFWPAPSSMAHAELVVPRAILRETIARSISEALESEPILVDAPGRVVGADSASIRGLGGHRLALTIDGVPLRNAGTPSQGMPEWLSIDPWMVERVAIERPAGLEDVPSGAAGALAVAMLETRPEPGTEAELELDARSADRSLAGHASAAATSGIAAIRVAGGYADLRPIRVATTSTVGHASQRADLSARARLFGRRADPLELRLGFDLDRLSGLKRTDLGLDPAPVESSNQRVLAFIRADTGQDPFRLTLLLARQMFRSELDTQSTQTAQSTRPPESAATWFAKAVLAWAPFTELSLRVGAFADASTASLAPVQTPTPPAPPGSSTIDGRTLSLAAFTGAELSLPSLSAQASASFLSLSSSLGDAPDRPGIDATQVLTRGGARLQLAGPFGLRADWNQGLSIPTARDLRDRAPAAARPETSLTLDFGPSLFRPEAWIELVGFYTELTDPLELQSAMGQSAPIDTVDIVGLEMTAGWLLFERLRLAGALAWADGKSRTNGRGAITSPVVTGRASLRYDFGRRGAFVEAHIKGTSNPLRIPSSSTTDFASPGETFIRIGAMGGLDLGLGFRFQLALENVLDAPHRIPQSLVPSAGVDLRAALSYAWR